MRSFLTQLARDADYRIRWAAMDRESNVVASRAAHRGDNALLREMLDELVEWAGEQSAGPAPQPRRPRD